MDREGRRAVLRQGGRLAALVACGFRVAADAAAPADPFDATTLDGAMRALGASSADASAVDSADVLIVAPDIAENGAVVPVTVTSRLPATDEIHLLVEGNPFPLAASVAIPQGTDAFVSLRVKLAESSRIHAVVRAGGRLHRASRDVKVTLGGCGG